LHIIKQLSITKIKSNISKNNIQLKTENTSSDHESKSLRIASNSPLPVLSLVSENNIYKKD